VHEETIPSADRAPTAEDIFRELTEAITRNETLGRTIEANLDDAEKEIEAIRRATTAAETRKAPS
jgi:hypothetical protein